MSSFSLSYRPRRR